MIHLFEMILFIFSIIFSAFILCCFVFWKRIPTHAEESIDSAVRISVIVAARNEGQNIVACLDSFNNQNFPHSQTEFIIVDDHSTDNTTIVIRKYQVDNPNLNLQFFVLANEGLSSKKDAITFAISKAMSDIILITDADCIVPPGWIKNMLNHYLRNNALLLAGPVDMLPTRSLFGKIQNLEFMGLVGIAAAGISGNFPIMCNGANLMFSKKVFQQLGGFDAAEKLASGDDTQLLLKVHKFAPNKVFFNKDEKSVVLTKSAEGWDDFVQQRKRWAGKIPFALTTFTITVAVLAWFTHAFLLLSFSLSLIEGKFNTLFFASTALICICELLLLNSMSAFLKKRSLLWLFLPLQFFYWIYIVLIGLIAPLGTFHWKDRITR